MLKVLFFAQTRELIEKEKLLVAINQTLMPLESALKSGDEIAFFPPVTGG